MDGFKQMHDVISFTFLKIALAAEGNKTNLKDLSSTLERNVTGLDC